jgi:hypothetical protein
MVHVATIERIEPSNGHAYIRILTHACYSYIPLCTMTALLNSKDPNQERFQVVVTFHTRFAFFHRTST